MRPIDDILARINTEALGPLLDLLIDVRDNVDAAVMEAERLRDDALAGFDEARAEIARLRAKLADAELEKGTDDATE